MPAERDQKTAPDAADETTAALGKILQMIDDGPIMNFNELARLVFSAGTEGEKSVLQRRTEFIESYMRGLRDSRATEWQMEEKRVRTAFQQSELCTVSTMSEEELRRRLDSLVAAMPKAELETTLGLIAGERGWIRRQEMLRGVGVREGRQE